jgi:predicted RNA binding protein YcfA (HicA-like mRNA interferase family)
VVLGRDTRASGPMLEAAVAAGLASAGWQVRQGGKHMVLTKPGIAARLTIPRHRTVKQGLLLRQIKNAGLTVEEFFALYR